MQRVLVDVLNHGLLPFTGREKEIDRLMQFRGSLLEVGTLQAALILSEAGGGKSRLIDQLLPRILAEEGTVIRVKFYPESTSALIPLIARACRDSDALRNVLSSEPDERPTEVLAALRRLARLRATTLVLEDIHLLSGDSIAELARLLDALADETLALICTARPVELPAQAPLEPYLAERVELRGFNREQVAELWRLVFDQEADPQVVERLTAATEGNPLALRSALRAAMGSGAVTWTESGGRIVRVSVDLPALSAILKRNVGLMSEGLGVHLSTEEREAACRLATLGEVFSREAAEQLVPEGERMLERLAFKGITAQAVAPPRRLPGNASLHLPIAFTHTLLHRFLVERSSVTADELLKVVAGDFPLHSLLPLKLLHQSLAGIDNSSAEEVSAAVERIVRIAMALSHSPDHEQAGEVFEVASDLFNLRSKDFGDPEFRRLRLLLLSTKVRLQVGRIHSEEYGVLVEQFAAETEGPLPEDLMLFRLLALRARHSVWYRRHFPASDPEVRERFRQEVEELLNRFPRLRHRQEFVEYLIAMAQAGSADSTMVRWVEGQVNALLKDETLDPAFREMVLREVGPFLLGTFADEGEREERRRLLEQLEAIGVEEDLYALFRLINFRESLGEYDQVLEMLDRSTGWFRENGLLQQYCNLRLMRLHVGAAFGLDLQEVLVQARELGRDAPLWLAEPLRTFTGLYLVPTGILRGDLPWTSGVVDEFLDGRDDGLAPEQRFLLRLSKEAPSKVRTEDLLQDDETPAALRLLLAGERDDPEMGKELEPYLLAPILNMSRLATRRTLLEILDRMADEHPPLRTGCERFFPQAVALLFDELAARKHSAFLQALFDQFGSCFDEREQKRREGRVAALVRERKGWNGDDGVEGRFSLSMIGTITARRPDGEEIPIRGARLRTVLGLMVADRMLRRPLEPQEFRYIAAGSDDDLDPEKARKTMNGAIFRIRELLGDDMVLTDGETPELNLERLDVDLLTADRSLREARSALRDGALMRGVPALRTAILLARGDVPFPSLYEDFFEGLRVDFESRLRSTLVDLARRLLREGDAVGAEALLRDAAETMPEDEEMVELLSDALVALDRRGDAERLRLKARRLAEEF